MTAVPTGTKSVGVGEPRPPGVAKYSATPLSENPNSRSMLVSFPMSQSLGVKCLNFGFTWELPIGRTSQIVHVQAIQAGDGGLREVVTDEYLPK